MKKLTILLLFFTSVIGFIQNKDAINYQSVIINGSGIFVANVLNINKPIKIKAIESRGDELFAVVHIGDGFISKGTWYGGGLYLVKRF